MTTIPFCGSSYTDKTLFANCQRSINLYPMETPMPQTTAVNTSQAKQLQKIIMYPTPGYLFQLNLTSYASTGTQIRGEFTLNTVLYVVVGNTLISLTPLNGGSNLATATIAVLGTLQTSSGMVSMQSNTVQLAISDGAQGYIYTFSSGAFTQISSTGSFPATGGVTNFTFYDDYIIGALNNSRQVIQSNVLDASTFGAQAFDVVGSFSDNLVGVFSDELVLYCFSPKLCEVQVDIGSIPYAFQKQAGVLIQAGCESILTVQKVGNTIIWLANDIAGAPFIATLQGYGAKPVSTPPINEILTRIPLATRKQAFSYTYREGDNHFYVITLGQLTLAYDTKMDMWHERSINGGADLPLCCVSWQGQQIVGDANGNLLVMSQTYPTYYDNASGKDIPMQRTRTCQHLNVEGMTMFIQELWIDFQVGSGFYTDANLKTQPTASAPLATLEASKDFGNTWYVVGTRSLGATGNYKTRAVWRTLGRFRQNATFRVTITDPVQTYILDAKAKIKQGTK